jgi:hypothetical protein
LDRQELWLAVTFRVLRLAECEEDAIRDNGTPVLQSQTGKSFTARHHDGKNHAPACRFLRQEACQGGIKLMRVFFQYLL